jgi:hypothetical protein
MIRERNITHTEIVIDLNGPSGNAYALIGHARKYAKQLGYTQEQIKTLTDDMTSGDYENLLQVFDKHFPFVILDR